jgi:polyhydroxyalkanoate synthesis regulator phasin
MQDAWRAYLEMALGLTEAPRKKAQQVVGDLVNRGGATAGQLQGLAEDLLATGVANREALAKIARLEVDRALGVVGLATADEVAELTSRVRELERQLRLAEAQLAAGSPGAAGPGGSISGAAVVDAPAPPPQPTRAETKAVAKKAVAKKAVAKKAVANKAVANKAVANKAVAKRAADKKAVAKKSTTKAAGTARSGGPDAAVVQP